MPLICGCDDFDKSEHDTWWREAGMIIPPEGTRCCECGAPLQQEKQACFLYFEVYEPDETAPEWDGPLKPKWPYNICSGASEGETNFWQEFNRNEQEWRLKYGESYEKFKEELDKYNCKYGWDSECERYQRETRRVFRCERCDGLAEAYEDLGFCIVAPGDVISANIEYAADYNNVNLKWIPDETGTLHPKEWTRWDYISHGVRSYRRNFSYWVRAGWKFQLRWKVIWPVERRINKLLGRQANPANLTIFGTRC